MSLRTAQMSGRLRKLHVFPSSLHSLWLGSTKLSCSTLCPGTGNSSTKAEKQEAVATQTMREKQPLEKYSPSFIHAAQQEETSGLFLQPIVTSACDNTDILANHLILSVGLLGKQARRLHLF